MAHEANSVRSIYYALGANLAVFAAKLVATVVTGSGAMMAESIHSLADSANQLLLLLGLNRAKRPPSEAYPLGPGKEIYFWSFIVALILFTMGGGFSVYEGIHKLTHPEALRNPWVALSVLAFAIIAETISLQACLVEANKARGERSLWRWFQESRQSELLVILGEDLAALFGLILALVAITATMLTGDPVYDALGSISIGLLLIIIAIFIGAKVKDLLVGQGVETQTRSQMLGFLELRPEIIRYSIFSACKWAMTSWLRSRSRCKMASAVESWLKTLTLANVISKPCFPR